MKTEPEKITREKRINSRLTSAPLNWTVIEKLDKLPRAVLAKAFRGELVPTEAELAREEGRDYETAQQLLERIKTGKKRLEQETKRGKHENY